ncbi:hypothetical protein ATI61_110125 [Archangium gephyra]|uniref:Uncharacterized protein n=1 Tax=Archangium gephyra TaxID=48 RepID=A0AAC8QF15_9BACT|nr:hypothetical protein [Archangium gephyra]AKJ06128.1 Hypothetical protein AA314_07754 [Archangium gephyra]REG27118.1 hypothetical protein ATI61_110125 [Archangium gephyra]
MSNGADVEQLDAPPPISAELRAKILSDPNVAKMAAELEMDLEVFVNTVGYYMNNPGVEPAFLVVSDENLKKMGVEAPTAEALEANVRASVEAFKAGQAPSGFEDARKKGVDLASQGGKPVETKADPGLDDAIKKGRTTLKP